MGADAVQLTLCPQDLREAVEVMLQELDYMGLVVGLIPAPERTFSDWQCVRAVWGHNPGWYRELCAMYPRYRRNRAARFTDSKVKRGRVGQVLRQMLGGGANSYLAEPLLAFAREIQRDMAAEAQKEEFQPCSPMVGGASGAREAACGF